MINMIPVFGWLLSFILYTSISVPFWYCWTNVGLGTKYFAFLPEQWQSIPFWDCVGLTFCVIIAKVIVFPNFSGIPSKKDN